MKIKKLKKFKKYFKPSILALTIFIILSFFGVWQIDFLKPKIIQNPPTPSPLYNDFHLIIPKLGIDAPIIADVNGADQAAYDKALEEGVAQLKGSAKPGEGSNIFIFGHSSYYWYKPGDYKEIFKNLPDLAEGDEIIIWYKQKEYKYKVIETKTVKPSEVDVILPTKKEQLSLMTCVPPGTTRQRLIVVARPEIGL